MLQNTVQIATFGEDQNGILAGIRNFPIHELAILCYEDDKQKAERFAHEIRSMLNIQLSFLTVSKNNVINDVMERVGEVVKRADGEQILMNVSGGDKMISCATLATAFINGVEVFFMDHEGRPTLFPVLKLSYTEVISQAKIAILQAVDKAGGFAESLEELGSISGYGKPLLSYHIQGGGGAKGLADLGLVEVERGHRGKIGVRLTTLGKLLITNTPIKLKT